jgi:plasmid replication initiation protein
LIVAKGALSGTAQKMLSMVISMLRTDDTEFQKYALQISSYKKEIGATNNEKEFYVNSALELMRNPFFIIEDGKRKFFNWCSTVQPDEMQGYIIFDIHNDLKPYLLELKENFTQYHLINILNLKGEYSPRLYEYLIKEWKQHKHYNHNSTQYSFDIKIDVLKELLSITKGYRYNDIKRQIIEKAKKDFKQYTDIQFDYEEQKIGRKVDRLIITIKSNNKGSNDNLKSLQSFIIYIRDKYAPKTEKNSYPEIFKVDGGESLKVDNKGYLYITKSGQVPDRMNKLDAQKWWEFLYNLAKDSTLEF